jgi:hypothetical protein
MLSCKKQIKKKKKILRGKVKALYRDERFIFSSKESIERLFVMGHGSHRVCMDEIFPSSDILTGSNTSRVYNT